MDRRKTYRKQDSDNQDKKLAMAIISDMKANGIIDEDDRFLEISFAQTTQSFVVNEKATPNEEE